MKGNSEWQAIHRKGKDCDELLKKLKTPIQEQTRVNAEHVTADIAGNTKLTENKVMWALRRIKIKKLLAKTVFMGAS